MTQTSKQHPCNFPLCGRVFKKSSELSHHVNSHRDKNMLFPCPALRCDYSSATKRGLLIHWHKQHAEDTTSPSDSSDSSDDSSSLRILHSPAKGGRSCKSSPSRRRQRANQIGPSSNGICGIPWKGRIWPYDFLDIMEDSAALNAATGGCFFLDTPDGRTGVVAHTLLPQIYEQYGLIVEWIVPSEEEEWTLESEVRRWAASYPTEMDVDEVTAVNTGPIGCLCPDWMVEAGIWDPAYLQSAGCTLDFYREMSEEISVGV